MDNQSLSHTKWKCQYHIVFIPKYRKKALYGKVKDDIREIISTLCKYKNVEIVAGAVAQDHVHLSVAIPPKISVSNFMGYLKGKSTLMIYDRHPELQSKDWMRYVVQGKADPVLLNTIDALPDGNTLCHGDFHPLNVIVTSTGRPYVIDFANICKAPRQYDIARTYMLLGEAVQEPPLADIYLEQMGVSYEEISRYVDVLRRVRVIEMQ